MTARDVLITGIGIVSSLGEGTDAHWRALTADMPSPALDAERFSPYTVHPLPEIDWSAQIPKRGDQRQMETWQRLGTYTAGLALDDAGMKGNEELCAAMDMVVAAGGGERDAEVDQSILDASLTRNDHGVLINEKLTTELRPTLFLAQLSNLLAGNISIVHKVTGSSRTFMGEEGAGVSAIETAVARIRTGQSSHVLVGGSFQTEHPDMLLAYELGGHLNRGAWKPVWQRQDSEGGGVVTGSGGVFLVLESREHAERRGRAPYAAIETVASSRSRRQGDGILDAVGTFISSLPLPEGPLMTVSGASGGHAATAAEKAALDAHPDLIVRAQSTMTGHLKEAQFPFAMAIGALAIDGKRPYAPFDDTETPFNQVPDAVLTTTIGYNCFEGAGLLTKA